MPRGLGLGSKWCSNLPERPALCCRCVASMKAAFTLAPWWRCQLHWRAVKPAYAPTLTPGLHSDDTLWCCAVVLAGAA
eukprot:15807-Heterococcus_DN1.PRE.2